MRRVPYARAAGGRPGRHDFLGAYVDDLPNVVDLDAIRAAGVRIGADPLGGASVAYWGEIAERHRLDLTVVNPLVDPTWRFMTLDWDGKIRMDCSSPYAMASLIANRDRFDIATGNDADADRHGIVTPDGGLLNPNHYLAVAISYLYEHRDGWPASGRGRQDAGQQRHDRPGRRRRWGGGCTRCRWASSGSCPVCWTARSASAARRARGRRSCAATARCGRPTRTAIILALLASEILAVTGRSPSEHYRSLTSRFGEPAYARVDAPATREEKAVLAQAVGRPGDRRPAWPASRSPRCRPRRPATARPSAGSRSSTESAWFAARPSGTEDVYKIYAESFQGPGPPGEGPGGGPDPGLLGPGLRRPPLGLRGGAGLSPLAEGRGPASPALGRRAGGVLAAGRLQASSRGASPWTRVRPRSARRPAATPSP